MITIVRGEIIGGVRLASRLGETEAAHAVERCLKRVERVVEGFRGRLLRSGDGQISAAFATPEDACHAAIEMQRRVADLPPASGVKLNIRLGIHGADTESAAGLIAAQLLELALPDQILCSREVLADVIDSVGLQVRDLQQLELSGGEAFQVMELIWHEQHEEPGSATMTGGTLKSLQDLEQGLAALREPANQCGGQTVVPVAGQPKLCVRYRGKAMLLDEKTPFVTLGRDLGNDLVVEDNKASRQHARIERRDGRYHLVDISTNGTFVTFAGEPEIFLRREDLPLRGVGVFCFGVSAKDPKAEQAEFEHM